MVSNHHDLELHQKGLKIQAGILLAYEKLVAKKAKEGGSLILSIDGEIKAVPAIELLEKLNKSA